MKIEARECLVLQISGVVCMHGVELGHCIGNILLEYEMVLIWVISWYPQVLYAIV